jgi:glucarate dehydratase
VTHDSQVAHVRFTPVAFAEPPIRNSAGVHGQLVARLIVEVETAAGAVGLGETFGDPHLIRAATEVAPHIVGHDVFDTVELGRSLGVDVLADGQRDVTSTSQVARPGTFAGTLPVKLYSAIETAFLDAQGHLLGRPVHALLGGAVRDEVEFCGYLFYKFSAHPDERPDRWGEVLDPDAMVRLAGEFIDAYGFGSLKVKGGVLHPDQEIDTLRHLARAFPGIDLRIDPNAAWTVPTSLHVARQTDGLLQYLEDPTPGLQGMAEVAERVPVKLATNMVVTSFRQLRECLNLGSADIILAVFNFTPVPREQYRIGVPDGGTWR